MRIKRINNWKDLLIISTLAFGLPLGTALIIAFWKEIIKPRDITLIYWVCMGGGFSFGGLMLLFFRIANWLKKIRKNTPNK